ncbi:hypothetical protein P4V41_21150 [Fictibacillus nanhaiensis]|uniref:hypothetical protein n=1 Tax=Fictibacillus nanhaiensis TaxID=742169 RepID=UPI002E1BBC22|nr:hypothetical protein [Fictibacillus nanhaiensis]
MHPSHHILETWKKFDSFPMETLTKAWYFNQGTAKKQRDVSLMKEHRIQYGNTGNCFDLALWLLDEFKQHGIKAFPIGSNFHSDEAHVAVVALDENGNRYLCDLGDQWLQPILVETNSDDYSEGKLKGFFPAAEIQVQSKDQSQIEILYHRPNGKVSKQLFDLTPIEWNVFLQGAEYSQNNIYPKPLFECRVPYKNETAHWEFFHWESFLSTNEGLFKDDQTDSIEHWVEVIYQRSGYQKKFLYEALSRYS